MGHITNMLLLTLAEPGEMPIRELHRWCREHAAGQVFEHISPVLEEKAGGKKVFTAEVYACCGNYFPWERLIGALPSFGWNSYDRDNTCLLVRDADVEHWIAINADGSRLPRSEADWKLDALSKMRERKGDAYVIVVGEPWNQAYFNVQEGRWTPEADEATEFYGNAYAPIVEMLRQREKREVTFIKVKEAAHV